jgi:hypothetical protein
LDENNNREFGTYGYISQDLICRLWHPKQQHQDNLNIEKKKVENKDNRQ